MGGGARAYRAAMDTDEIAPWQHPGHKPVQHRDRKPPWCNECGWSSPAPAVAAVQLGTPREITQEDLPPESRPHRW